jgi:HlyD family secretion protein
MADTYVYSPCDGIVISREAEAGDAITSGAPIFRIADTSVIWIVAYIDETMAGEIEVGNPARVSLRSRSQESLPGKVARVEVESDRVTEERAVDITFPVPSDVPPIGEQAEVYVVTRKKEQVPALPNSSLVLAGKKHGIWIIKDGHVNWRDVQVGIKDPSGWVEIVSGLGKDEQVANASPSIMAKLKEGSRVSIHKEKL